MKAALLGALAGVARRPSMALDLVGLSRSGALDERALLEVVEALPEGDFELICHPGREPGTVPEDPRWRYGWEPELGALVSEAVRKRLAERQVELTTYGALFGSA